MSSSYSTRLDRIERTVGHVADERCPTCGRRVDAASIDDDGRHRCIACGGEIREPAQPVKTYVGVSPADWND